MKYQLFSTVNVYGDLYSTQKNLYRKPAMFERYTKTARKAVISSKHKATYIGSPEIGTEHLLLGLLSTDSGLANRFLGSPWAADSVWERIVQSGKIGDPIQGPCDLPLSSVGKRSLSSAEEEAERLSSKHVSTEHLFLGLLREEKCFAAEFLREHGIDLGSAREDLARMPHKYSSPDEFVRERNPLPEDVIELQKRVRSIVQSVEDAVRQRDFAKARQLSEAERTERWKLRSLYQRHGLLDWLYECGH